MKPVHRLARNHVFTLCNFARDIKTCDVCGAYLNGLFFQGYKCKFCEIQVHRHCLTEEMNVCKDNATVSSLDKGVRRDNGSGGGGGGSVSRRKPSLHNQVCSQDLFVSTTTTTTTPQPTSPPTSTDELFFKTPSTIATHVVVVGHGRTLREYNGLPKPPTTRGPLPPLIFAPNEIVWLTEMNEVAKVERGEKDDVILEDSNILKVI
jgi:hypothetical protein